MKRFAIFGLLLVASAAFLSAQGVYRDYTASDAQAKPGEVRVLFFHAKWCPTCKAANLDFTMNQAQIPKGIALLKVDYDTQNALKRKYGITYQHTFVVIDADGNALKTWSGGATPELLANTAAFLPKAGM